MILKMIDINAKSIGATMLPYVGGFLGAKLFMDPKDKWYRKLKKPWFNPPEIAFPIVWNGLFAGMEYASYLVYRDGGGFDGAARTPLMIYAAKLAVNWSFAPIYFGARKLGWTAIDVCTLWILVGVTMKSFHEINPNAAYLLIPYQIWMTLASVISVYIWKNNPKQG